MPNTEDARCGRIVTRDEFGYAVPVKAENVLCGDGKRRTVRFRASGPDTFFSIPGSVKVGRKTVSGFVTHWTFEDAERGDTVSVLVFVPYKYLKNANVLPPLPRLYSRVKL